MNRLRLACRTWREWVPLIGHLIVTGDVGRFERDSRAYRRRYGIEEDGHA